MLIEKELCCAIGLILYLEYIYQYLHEIKKNCIQLEISTMALGFKDSNCGFHNLITILKADEPLAHQEYFTKLT